MVNGEVGESQYTLYINTLYNNTFDMAVVKNKPVFAKRIFWDVNFDTLDYDKKASFVIERVFERGDVDDIRQCRRYYGDETTFGKC